MSAHFVPAKDPNAQRLEQIENSLKEVLRPYIIGKGKEKRLEQAVQDSIVAIRPLLKLSSGQKHGATVMTEAASLNITGKKGPKNL